ncbi:fatty acid desaturase [Bradyrhizobium sp. USDA 4501]
MTDRTAGATANDASSVRWGGVVLVAYLGLIVALLLLLFRHFDTAPLWAKLIMLWVGCILGGRLEAILHWTTHFPVFRSPALNTAHRLCFCVLPLPAIWYRYLHFHHHRFNNGDADTTTTMVGHTSAHASIWAYLRLALRELHILQFFREMKVRHKVECIASFVMTLVLAAVLALLDWRAAVLFWLPVTWVGSTLMVAVYNYTDHVPGVPADPYRYATYVPLDSRYRRFLSALDLHNISTHLTHHRAPGIYWTELPRRQATLEAAYRDHGAPVSAALNSAILFNPIAFVRMLFFVNGTRNRLMSGHIRASPNVSAG